MTRRGAHASRRQGRLRRALGGTLKTACFVVLVVVTATTLLVELRHKPEAVAVPAGPVKWTSAIVPVTYDGLARSYLLVHPTSGFTGSLPVVVMLHGHSVTPTVEEDRDDWVGITGPSVIVLPTGTGPSANQGWDAGNCCGYPVAAHVDDIGFIEAVTAQVLATVPHADPTRVYLAGYSNGGKMALAVACADPARWAAVAVYGTTASEPCARQAPLSFLFAGDTGDTEIDIGPGGTPVTDPDGYVEPTVTAEVATFATADGCGAPMTTVTGILTEHVATCARGREVAEAIYQGGNHGLQPAVGPAPGVIALMWSYFADLGA